MNSEHYLYVEWSIPYINGGDKGWKFMSSSVGGFYGGVWKENDFLTDMKEKVISPVIVGTNEDDEWVAVITISTIF